MGNSISAIFENAICHILRCFLDIAIWISHRHFELKDNKNKSSFLYSYTAPPSPFVYSSVFTTLLNGVVIHSVAISQIGVISDSFFTPQSIEFCPFYLCIQLEFFCSLSTWSLYHSSLSCHLIFTWTVGLLFSVGLFSVFCFLIY